LGYEKDIDAVEILYTIPDKHNEKVARIADMVIKKYELRILDMPKRRMIKRYGEPVFKMLDKCYSELYGTVPLTDGVIRSILGSFGLIARLELMSFVLDRDGNPIGAAIALPSIGEAVRRNRGRLTPLGIFRIIRAVRRPKVIDMALIGVTPEYRNRGVNTVIIGEVAKGEKVQITGFGSFERKTRGERNIKNPRTGEDMKVPPSKSPSFTAGSVFKEKVNK